MTQIVAAPRTFAEAERILAQTLPNYTRRQQQGILAQAVEAIFANGGQGLFQAGCGTGKSIAYLVPAILAAVHSGKRVIVATSTKALQEQVANKDMPFLEEHLGVNFAWAVLKGRSNYLCQQKIAEVSEADIPELAEIERLLKADIGHAGDVEHFEIPEMNNKWGKLTMSSTECPGRSDCHFGETCFAEVAKDKAADADVVITNTAMLMLDLRIRQLSDDTVQMLGEYDLVVIDEAHELPEIATNTLSEELRSSQVDKLALDAMSWLSTQRTVNKDGEVQDSGYFKAATATTDKIKLAVADLWMKLEDKRGYDKDGKANTEPIQLPQVWLVENSENFLQILEGVRELGDMMRDTRTRNGGTKAATQKKRLIRRCENMEARLARLLTTGDDEMVRWLETEKRTVRRGQTEEVLTLKASPIEVGTFLQEMLWDITPTVMVSATLAVGTSFDYITKTLGLEGYEPLTIDVGTPFDYTHQARLFLPAKNMPSPAQQTRAEWESYARSTTLELVRKAGGGALLLFTSRANMDATYAAIAPLLESQGIRCLKQGESPNKVLAREFAADTNSCLFALKSFFVGVDFAGDTCRLVVIDKMPFPVPTDLLFKARCDAYDRREGSGASFYGISIPVMTLTLVQGFGRLIRHLNDAGVVAILDSRLSSTNYGKSIAKKLPPAPVINDPAQVEEFFRIARLEMTSAA